MRYLKRFRFWLGILVSILFLIPTLQALNLGEVWDGIQEADYGWLIPGVAVYFVAVLARTWRWDYLLRPLKPIKVRALFPVVVIGYMGNNLFPLRIGELLRAYVLREREGVSVSASLATVVVERIFDGLIMLLFVFVALPFTPVPGDAVRTTVIIGSVGFLAAMIIFFVLAALPEQAFRLATWASNLFLPYRVRDPLLDFTRRFLDGLVSLRSWRSVLMIFFTSAVIWLLETVKYWFVMHAFPFEVSFFALMLMNGVVNLATTLPSAPGYLGTFDGPGIAVLVLYGVAGETAAAYTLVLHAALWLPITALGVFYMIRSRMSWSDFGQAAQLAEQEAAT